MRFKLDENVPLAIVKLLEDAGHDARTVLDEQLGGADDARIIAAAAHESRALITLDKDFADIRSYPPDRSAGIVVLRSTDQTVSGLSQLVARLIPLLETENLAGKLWVVDERRVRMR